MKLVTASVMALALLVAMCSPAPPPARGTDAARQSLRITSQPPVAKDIIETVLASASVPLAVSPTCQNVGTEPSDATIGRYLAGFMAEMSAPNLGNAIETTVTPGTSRADEPVWLCRLTLRHADGDDRWRWGVEFQVRQRDGQVLADSFICTGAG